MRIPFTIVMVSLTAWHGRTASAGDGYADLVEQISSAVVFIQTTQSSSASPGLFQDFFRNRNPPREAPRGSGSGFLISEDGYIVTNRHVVADSQTVKVELLNGRSYEATVVGVDNSLDIAILKIEDRGLNHLVLGDSGPMRIGDPVLALGYPLALGFSVTSGIISGLGRNMRTGSMDLASYIQTDADISYGNSGGPLVNKQGAVIGINTLIVSQGDTFGFAIPSDVFRSSIDQLKKHGKVQRGALGIQVGDLSSEAREYYKLAQGALIASVTAGFPAERAGLKPDDIILEVDGVKVRGGNDVVSLIAARPPGAKVRLRIISDGKEALKLVTLGDRNKLVGETNAPDPPEPESRPENLNFDLSEPPSSKNNKTALHRASNRGGQVLAVVERTAFLRKRQT